MEDKLFTIICEFRGGTYASQVTADDEVAAVRTWANQIRSDKPFPRASAHVARNVLQRVEQDGLVPLTGLAGVWCFSGLVANELILGNVISTCFGPAATTNPV